MGDVIPYFDSRDGRYHLFYLSPLGEPETLHERLNGVQWEHVSSVDLVEWRRHSAALLADSPGIDSGGALTGCIIRRGDTWYLFYCAADPMAKWPQTICMATSRDLEHFEKSDANPILVPPGEGFEHGDWRDPFVYWNPDADEYWMLISARVDRGPAARRGALALATSPDLLRWTTRSEPYFAPSSTLVPECAEVVTVGREPLLGYSAYSGRAGMHYFRNGVSGWEPVPGYTDGAAWYAGKSLTDNRGRVLSFAWIPDRQSRMDRGRMLWGGDFATPRELRLDPDGALGHHLPAEVLGAFDEPVAFTGPTGVASHRNTPLTAEILEVVPGPGAVMLTVRMRWASASGRAGVLIRPTADLDAGLMLSISPAMRTVALHELSDSWTHMVEQPYGPWVSHTATSDLPTDSTVQVIVDGSCVECFVDGRMSLSHRYYGDGQPLRFALFAEHAEVTFDRVELRGAGTR